jgi:cytochrome c biogenesis protein CcmG, thiol:disulfide interchange protein DsbE
MRRFAVPGLISLIAVALLALLAFGVANDADTSSLDAKVASGHFPVAPTAHLKLPLLVSGKSKSESLASLRGHVVMVDFFAGWCDACQLDAGVVASAERRLEQAGGTVIGVTYDDSSSDALSYMKQYHLSFPVLRDANGALASAYGVNGVPETFIINAEGKVVAIRREQLVQGWMNTTLNRALSKTA